MRHRNAAISPWHRLGIVALAALGLVVPLAVGTISTAQATASAPTGVNVVASTANGGLGGAVPTVLVQAGSAFTLAVSLSPDGATFNKDTTLSLTPSLDPAVGGSPHGSFSPSPITFPAGVSSQSFSVSYSAVDNGVILTASVAAKGKTGGVTPGSTAPFDVLSTLLPLAKGNPQFADGVGVGTAGCTQATTEPECGTVVLPNDIESSNAALSLGKCTANLGCTSGSQVVQFIGDLGTRYTPQTPATLIFRCDKQVCRNSNNGVKGFTLKVSQSATGPLDHVSQPCAAKGVADNGLNNGDTFCTDYVQSHRDNSGDLLLFLLFTQDMRGST
ncbi:MAG TPA: hypothetical protein VGL39_01950 [Jatrophihabitantaceae bacterium]|jgi:hypothetical protein